MPWISTFFDTLSGAVERITNYNPENGNMVLCLRPDTAMSAPLRQQIQSEL
jgi:hypothetical protein